MSTKSKKFKPFTIRIRTKKEAINLWHRLNAAPDNFKKYITYSSGITMSDLCNSSLWSKVDKHYKPKSY